MAGDDADFGEVGNDVGGDAALGDDVVDARLLGDMLAQHVDGVECEFDGVERRPPGVWRGSRVGWPSSKCDAGGDIGQPGVVVSRIEVSRMPREDHIDVAEQAGADHEDLAAAAFFRGRAVEADGAIQSPCLHLLFRRHRRQRRGGAEKVVAAPMPGRIGDAGRTLRLVLL